MKVKITKDNYWYEGYIGKIFDVREYDDKFYELSDERHWGIHKEDCEVVPEEQWLTAGEALVLAIKGTPVQYEGQCPDNHIEYFNGQFIGRGKHGNTWVAHVENCVNDKWKLWEEPKPEPKFSIGQFVVSNEDHQYLRITKVIPTDTGYDYEGTGFADESGDVFHSESELTAV